MRLSRVTPLAVLALATAACTSASIPSTTSTTTPTATTIPATAVSVADVTPRGWVPVDYGDAQVSVPSTWQVSHGYTCATPERGTVQLGLSLVSPGCPTQQPRVLIAPLLTSSHSVRHGHTIRVNHLTLYVGPSAGVSGYTYFAPALHVEITTAATSVLETLTFSPRAVVLSKGPAPQVPRTWRWLDFGGLRFAVPSSWPVDRGAGEFTCYLDWQVVFSTFAGPGTAVILSTDTQQDVTFNCPAEVVPRHIPAPTNGFRLDLRRRAHDIAYSSHCLDIHGLRVCPSGTWNYSVLFAAVHVPSGTKPVFLMLGMADNGRVARTVLQSLRAA
jgi:hypothetical protein